MELYFDPESEEYIIEDGGHALNLKQEELEIILKNPTGITIRRQMGK